MKRFFKQRETYIGIGLALAFQLAFFFVWLSGYHGESRHVNPLRMAVVNDDPEQGKEIVKAIHQRLTYKISDLNSLHQAKKNMNQLQYDMIVYIPGNFSTNILKGKTANINFYINQSNSKSTRKAMENVAKEITTRVNEEVFIQKKAAITKELKKQSESQNKDNILKTPNLMDVINGFRINGVHATIIKTNEVKSFSATMVPMMVVLASFVGAMIMSLQLSFAAKKISRLYSKWSLFISRQLINLGIPMFISILTVLLMLASDVHFKTSIFVIWLFQSLVLYSFLCLSQLFIILFGNAGMLLNIIILSAQLVTSGVIIPRMMLSSFFQTIGKLLPATYAANGYFTTAFGDGNLTKDIYCLLLISITCLLLSAIRILLAKENSPQTNATA
ncbi:YhgE/Pip domain-containing protein [Fictibacillus gelatini]|uniref:YhgE/Pip domain-containing protein n=1 Tax=Fictibacillus gelatini TaxID=225985 RepID=UPI001FE0D3D9|nr:ABC transporter permease [Fictibacillus gelatini]